METTSTSTSTRFLIANVFVTAMLTTFAFVGCAFLGAMIGVAIETSFYPDSEFDGFAGLLFGGLAGISIGVVTSLFFAIKSGTGINIATTVGTLAAIPVLYVGVPLIF